MSPSASSSRCARGRARRPRSRRERRSTAVDREAAPAAPARRPGRRFVALLWRPFRFVLLALLVVIIFVEEWGWRPLAALAAAIARWPPLAVLERRIRAAPRHVALALFLVPAILLFPVKLAALWLIQAGRPTLGIAVIVAAKVVGTAFVGRLFILVETQLMTFAWFVRGVEWWRATRDRVMAALRQSVLWRSARAVRRVARRWLKRLLALKD
jgi:hypothetical protein